MIDMQRLQYIQTCQITHDTQHIRYDTTAFMSQFHTCPPLHPSIEMYQERRQQDGKEIDQRQHHQTILPRQQVHITKQEHDDKTHKRQIERGEYQTDDPGGIDNTFLSAYHDYFTFSTLQ